MFFPQIRLHNPREMNHGTLNVSFIIDEQKGLGTRRLVIQLPAGTLRGESEKHFWVSVRKTFNNVRCFLLRLRESFYFESALTNVSQKNLHHSYVQSARRNEEKIILVQLSSVVVIQARIFLITSKNHHNQLENNENFIFWLKLAEFCVHFKFTNGIQSKFCAAVRKNENIRRELR